ncbi:hypothetical protein [Photobacterium swingsii]|uniref:hypothetical protein n=1 Tax=Photobacterium swingsii TaxID=680026 RepID=UPI004067625D
MELYQTILVAAATGFCSAFGTGIAMKTDIAWIKRIVESHEKRLISIEKGK